MTSAQSLSVFFYILKFNPFKFKMDERDEIHIYMYLGENISSLVPSAHPYSGPSINRAFTLQFDFVFLSQSCRS